MTTISHHQRLGIPCPDCTGMTRIRTSRSISLTCRQATLACLNTDCGATFGYLAEITHRIAQPPVMNPAIHLPTAPPRNRRPANDTHPIAANDGAVRGPEVPPIAANDDVAAAAEVAAT